MKWGAAISRTCTPWHVFVCFAGFLKHKEDPPLRATMHDFIIHMQCMTIGDFLCANSQIKRPKCFTKENSRMCGSCMVKLWGMIYESFFCYLLEYNVAPFRLLGIQGSYLGPLNTKEPIFIRDIECSSGINSTFPCCAATREFTDTWQLHTIRVKLSQVVSDSRSQSQVLPCKTVGFFRISRLVFSCIL